MVNTVKEFLDVALQSVTGTRIIIARLTKHLFNCLYSFVSTFIYSARKRSGYKGGLENRIEYLKKGMVQNPISDSSFMNMPKLRISNIKTFVISMSVNLRFDISAQLKNILFKIFLKEQYISLATFSFPKLSPSQK